MIVTDHFTFVHLHKCGGSFVSRFLLRFFPSARRIGYHYPWGGVPPAQAGLPVLGCVRNPWSFYVSYYFFQIEVLAAARERIGAMSPEGLVTWSSAGNDPLNGVDVLFQEASADGTAGFGETTRALLRLGTDDGLLDRVLDVLPVTMDRRDRSGVVQSEGFRGMNVRAQDLTAIRGSGGGLFTFLFRHLYGDAADAEFLRLEHLREDLTAYLRRRGLPVTPEMERFLRAAAPVNTSRHEPYPGYYDDSLAALVRARDGEIARRFGYQFDAVASTR